MSHIPRRAVEEELHINDFGGLPVAQVAVETRGSTKRFVHVCNSARVPFAKIARKLARLVEHPLHVWIITKHSG